MAVSDDYLVDQLLDMGIITDEELAEAQTAAEETDGGVIDTMVTKAIISAENVLQAKAASFGAEIIDLDLPEQPIGLPATKGQQQDHAGDRHVQRPLAGAAPC